MLKYRLEWADGSDAGARECSTVIHPHEIIWIGGGKRLHVLEVRPVEPGSPFVALLRVERADGPPKTTEIGRAGAGPIRRRPS